MERVIPQRSPPSLWSTCIPARYTSRSIRCTSHHSSSRILLTLVQELYSEARWTHLANLFMQTHNSLLSLPSVPLLHIALSAGLSALKTPSCHSSRVPSISPTSSSSVTTSVCPICSTELNDLARNVPYAHHTKSHVESDLVLLPNYYAYGLTRLLEYSRKAGLGPGQIKDLRNGEVYDVDTLKKVYIS
jgi:macrophage erythroblast attacher